MLLFSESHTDCSSIYCANCLRRELERLVDGDARAAYPRKLARFVERRGRWKASDHRLPDAVQEFCLSLLIRRRWVREELIGAPAHYFVARLGIAYDRFAYERLRPEIIRSVRKAIDGLVRRTGTSLVPSGNLLGTSRHEAIAPERLFRRDGKFDPVALEAAVVCELLRAGPTTRNALARSIVERWDLVQGALAASVPAPQHTPESALHARRTAAELARYLSLEERTALADLLGGRILELTADTLGCSIATAHGYRESARRRLRDFADASGLDREQVARVLFTFQGRA